MIPTLFFYTSVRGPHVKESLHNYILTSFHLFLISYSILCFNTVSILLILFCIAIRIRYGFAHDIFPSIKCFFRISQWLHLSSFYIFIPMFNPSSQSCPGDTTQSFRQPSTCLPLFSPYPSIPLSHSLSFSAPLPV